MRAARLWLLLFTLVTLFAVAGCGMPGTSGDTGNDVPPPTPTFAPPPTATISVPMRDASFTTQDGVHLGGTVYGSGTTGVVLSPQINGLQSQWTGFARVLAAHGYLALTFDFRGRGASDGRFNTATEDTDLRAAVRYLRSQGAKRIILMGASLGGAVSLRVAATEPVVAVATLSAIAGYPSQPVTSDIIKAIKAPKLFINSEGDPAAADTQHMYDVASEPKEIHLYPGNAHGVMLFSDRNSPDLTERLLAFLATYAPA